MQNEITFIDEDNNEKKGYLLSKICYDNKEYIIYTDNYRNMQNKLRLFASRIEIVDDKIYTYKIETEDEWEYLEKIIKSIEGEI